MSADALAQRLAERLGGRTALVTGGASGLGRAIAEQLAAAGWIVGVLDRSEAAAQAAAKALAGHALVADVSDADAVQVAVDDFAGTVGPINLLINSAGIAVAGSVAECPAADFALAMQVNYLGTVHVTQAALPHLHAANANAAAHICNIASGAAFLASPRMGAYNASKAAVLSFSETLSGELQGSNIGISVVMPTFIRTPLLGNMRAPEADREAARLLMAASDYTPDACATDVLQAAADGRFYVPLPRKLNTAWRLKRWAPNWFRKRLPALRENKLAALQAAEDRKHD